MTPILIVMAILGCSDGGDQCQTVEVAPTHYASVTACNAAAEATLGRYTGIDFPVVAVRCQKSTGPTIVAAEVQPAG